MTAPPVPAVPETITLRFTVEPATATIQIDGKPASTEQTVTKDGGDHQLTITAAGFADYSETITFDETQRIKVSLEKTRAKPTSRPTTRPKPTTTTTKPDRTNRIDSQSPYGN